MAIILGIDPGSRSCGYGLINAIGNRLEYVSCGTIKVADLPFSQRLKVIHNSIIEIIETHSPQQVAIEEVFMGKNASSALKLGQARGAAIVACANRELEIAEYPARKVKQAVVGNGQATKAQMQHMVTSLLSLSRSPAEDAADALGIAICHANTQMGLIKMVGVRSSRKRRLIS